MARGEVIERPSGKRYRSRRVVYREVDSDPDYGWPLGVCDTCDAVWEFALHSPYAGGGDWERLEPLEARKLRKLRAERIQNVYREAEDE